MGGMCSKNLEPHNRPPSTSTSTSASNLNGHKHRDHVHAVASKKPPQPEKQFQHTKPSRLPSSHRYTTVANANDDDDNNNNTANTNTNNEADVFYDGIPRYPSLKSRSTRSRQAAVAKVSEVGSRLGRAGTLGFGKAVDVLDTLGSSMTNLNPNSGFASGVATKGNELAILAFEVANTIVKGSSLMLSISRRSIRHLKEVVLPSEGVQNLISNDMDELLRIHAADKREDLKIILDEVIRFGNRCRDPQWHNLDRYFEKISRERTPQRQLKDEAESVMELLMTLVQYTAELYHELQVLDRIKQQYQHKRQQDTNTGSNQKGGNIAILRAEMKSQKKQVRNLQKKSLWSRSLEEVMEKFVEVVHYLLLEINNNFGCVDGDVPFEGSVRNHQRLGPAGLSLHYANVILQIDNLVARPSSMPPNTRNALYESLPPSVKSALRSKLQFFLVKEEMTITEIKDEMEKTLQWLVPLSANTAKAHHGFGWVGEWANGGTDVNRKTAAVIRIDTLHHADKEKTEAYILDLVLWLHHLVKKSKNGANDGGMKSPFKSPIKALPNSNQQLKHKSPRTPLLTIEDEKMLEDVNKRKRIRGISKSNDFESAETRLRGLDGLSKSNSHSSTSESKSLVTDKREPSVVPKIAFGIDKESIKCH